MTAEFINAVALGLFVILLFVGTASVAYRMWRFHQAGIPKPKLIWRDQAVFGLLAFTFLSLLVHRVAGLPFVDETWWALITAGAAVVAIGIFDYFELVIIGHRRDGPPDVTEHHNGTTITTHGPSTITVEPDGTTEVER